MQEAVSTIREGWENFKAGGGVKTIARRFVQTAPFAAVGAAGIGFIAGEIGPGLLDLLSPNPPSLGPIFTPEYGMNCAGKGTEIGITIAAIEAIVHPFVIGRQIRDGELDEVPPMPNIGHFFVNGLRRSFDAAVNYPRDFREGGGWQEFQSNLAIFLTGGVVLGGAAGIGVDALATADYDVQFMPTEAAIGGVAAGAVAGTLLAAEITTAPARLQRRQEEGLTTPRTLFRRPINRDIFF